MIGKILISILILIVSVLELKAQDSLRISSYFLKRDFGSYFYSDKYAPNVNIGIGAMRLFDNYDIGINRNGYVIVSEPTIGGQIPIYYSKDRVKKWALSVPLSFSVWFDFTENRTAPILNTDYRFSLLEFNYSLTLNNSRIKNVGFRFTPFSHESTHVGDELTISKLRDSIPVARINVSYESFELSFVINDPYKKKIKNHSARLGAKFLWNPQKGYYSADPIEMSTPIEIQLSERWVEPYLQYQFQNPNGWLSNDKMMFVLSQDLFLRVNYGYGVYYIDNLGKQNYIDFQESYQLCNTTMVGWTFYNSKKQLSNSSLFLKFYYGINPHGQFRNIPKYPWIGLNWIYAI